MQRAPALHPVPSPGLPLGLLLLGHHLSSLLAALLPSKLPAEHGCGLPAVQKSENVLRFPWASVKQPGEQAGVKQLGLGRSQG